jgi:hypothetical protein
MLTTVAVLVIVLGLMVSLARDVRNRSADRLTKDLLHRLDDLVAQYRVKNLKNVPEPLQRNYPLVRPLFATIPAATGPAVSVPVTGIDAARLRERAVQNCRDLIRAIKTQTDLSGGAFSDLSVANYNEVIVLDAWGSPIVYMAHQHPAIGMAAGDRYFFFSAGPDRNYLTRQDNLYSYETGPPPPASPTTQ